MPSQNKPAAEVDITPSLVGELLSEQHPDLAGLELVEVASGWDNVIHRLGDDLVVRVPRRAMAARLVEHEQKALAALGPRLPIPVPVPVRTGRPSAALGYPWSWSITTWMAGTVADRAPLADRSREARRLGEFLAALHVPARPDAPINPFRGHFVGDHTQRVLQRIEGLRGTGLIDVDRAVSRWHFLLDGVERWRWEPTWIHGDLHLANMLVDDLGGGPQISAIIDWGDVCAGDPATDVSIAWSMFDGADLATFRDAAGGGRHLDDHTWRRAEAWALHFAVVYLQHSADDPLMSRIGARLVSGLGLAAA